MELGTRKIADHWTLCERKIFSAIGRLQKNRAAEKERKGKGGLRGEVGGGLIRDDFKTQQREFILDSLLNR